MNNQPEQLPNAFLDRVTDANVESAKVVGDDVETLAIQYEIMAFIVNLNINYQTAAIKDFFKKIGHDLETVANIDIFGKAYQIISQITNLTELKKILTAIQERDPAFQEQVKRIKTTLMANYSLVITESMAQQTAIEYAGNKEKDAYLFTVTSNLDQKLGETKEKIIQLLGLIDTIITVINTALQDIDLTHEARSLFREIITNYEKYIQEKNKNFKIDTLKLLLEQINILKEEVIKFEKNNGKLKIKESKLGQLLLKSYHFIVEILPEKVRGLPQEKQKSIEQTYDYVKKSLTQFKSYLQHLEDLEELEALIQRRLNMVRIFLYPPLRR
jgi:hypothetical protein